jgi:hypothetical protein
VDAWRGHGVVGMKTALAYTIGLSFSDPSPEQARAAFEVMKQARKFIRAKLGLR